jgi:transposase
MTVVAQEFEYVIGVDTHAATHGLAVLAAATGVVLSKAKFPTSPAGLVRAADWITRHAPGKRLVCIEGTGSYGATLTRLLIERGQDVCEVKPPARTARAGKGKTDDIDAVAAARSVLSVETDCLISPRADGVRAAIRVLLAARKSIDGRRTADRSALTMLLRTYDLGVDARRSLTPAQLEQIAT